MVSGGSNSMQLRARLAASLLCGLGMTGAAVAQPLSSAQMQAQSAEIAEIYLQVWSSSGSAALAGVPYVYGPRVLFYGRAMDQRGLEAEKRRFIQRWPVRHYTHRPGTMQVTCNEQTLRCAARSIMDWRVENPQTGRTSQGSSRFDLGIAFGGSRPVIEYESGGTLRRGAAQ